MNANLASVPAEVDALVVRAECEELFHAFGACIDENRATEAIGVFAEDAVLAVGGHEYRGRDEILGFLKQREARTDRHTRHVGLSFRLRRVDEGRAEASAVMAVFAGSTPDTISTTPDVVSDCELVFARAPGVGWQVTSRRHRRFAERTEIR